MLEIALGVMIGLAAFALIAKGVGVGVLAALAGAGLVFLLAAVLAAGAWLFAVLVFGTPPTWIAWALVILTCLAPFVALASLWLDTRPRARSR